LAEAHGGSLPRNRHRQPLLRQQVGAIFLPLLSPRAHDNVSDDNAIEPDASFGINNNSGRIPIAMIQRECRDRLQAAGAADNQRPDLSDPKRSPTLSLPAWRIVMQLDQSSAPLPANFRMHLDEDNNQLQIDLPSASAIPTAPAGAADDFDLLGQPIKAKDARAGAIQNLHTGFQKISVWPLPAVARASSPP
jgi:hypothetical protein